MIAIPSAFLTSTLNVSPAYAVSGIEALPPTSVPELIVNKAVFVPVYFPLPVKVIFAIADA